MRLGRILYPVTALGPGKRLGIWVSGCERDCPGCANPELKSFSGPEIPAEMFLSMCRSAIKSYLLDGITITGGEPMLQAGELLPAVKECKKICPDILVFTGYTYRELKEMNRPEVNEFLSLISVLVDSPYIQERNRGEILRGSDNQNILYLEEQYREKYERYINENRHVVDSFAADRGVIYAGIHPGEGMEKWPGHQPDLR